MACPSSRPISPCTICLTLIPNRLWRRRNSDFGFGSRISDIRLRIWFLAASFEVKRITPRCKPDDTPIAIGSSSGYHPVCIGVSPNGACKMGMRGRKRRTAGSFVNFVGFCTVGQSRTVKKVQNSRWELLVPTCNFFSKRCPADLQALVCARRHTFVLTP